tara:strand:+ start:1048 stop:1341 length:294 start_codon:yes stop_codon:yes gene_type:complete
MAKLTESYLRNIIKQVMNEMYQYDEEEDDAVLDLADSFGQDEVGMLSPTDLQLRIARVQGMLSTVKDPTKLAEIERLIKSAQELHGMMNESRNSKRR